MMTENCLGGVKLEPLKLFVDHLIVVNACAAVERLSRAAPWRPGEAKTRTNIVLVVADTRATRRGSIGGRFALS